MGSKKAKGLLYYRRLIFPARKKWIFHRGVRKHCPCVTRERCTSNNNRLRTTSFWERRKQRALLCVCKCDQKQKRSFVHCFCRFFFEENRGNRIKAQCSEERIRCFKLFSLFNWLL